MNISQERYERLRGLTAEERADMFPPHAPPALLRGAAKVNLVARFAIKPVGDRRWRAFCWTYAHRVVGFCIYTLGMGLFGLVTAASTFSGSNNPNAGLKPSGPSDAVIVYLWAIGVGLLGAFMFRAVVKQVGRADELLDA